MLEGLFSTLGYDSIGMTTIVPLFLMELGAGTAVIGELNTVRSVAGGVMPLLMGGLVAAVTSKRKISMPNFSLINPIRVLKFAALFCTGFLGFSGLILFPGALLSRLVSMESLGVLYFSPFAPNSLYVFVRSLIFNISFSPFKPTLLNNLDKTLKKVRALVSPLHPQQAQHDKTENWILQDLGGSVMVSAEPFGFLAPVCSDTIRRAARRKPAIRSGL